MDVPGGGYYEDIWLMEGSDTKLPVTELKTDPYFIDFMGFSLVSGRNFNPDNPADKLAAIPNESTVRLFGYEPEEALGKKIIYPGDEQTKFEIIGVVKTFITIPFVNPCHRWS
jgi:putative ABC transport system permease protein